MLEEIWHSGEGYFRAAWPCVERQNGVDLKGIWRTPVGCFEAVTTPPSLLVLSFFFFFFFLGGGGSFCGWNEGLKKGNDMQSILLHDHCSRVLSVPHYSVSHDTTTQTCGVRLDPPISWQHSHRKIVTPSFLTISKRGGRGLDRKKGHASIMLHDKCARFLSASTSPAPPPQKKKNPATQACSVGLDSQVT